MFWSIRNQFAVVQVVVCHVNAVWVKLVQLVEQLVQVMHKFEVELCTRDYLQNRYSLTNRDRYSPRKHGDFLSFGFDLPWMKMVDTEYVVDEDVHSYVLITGANRFEKKLLEVVGADEQEVDLDMPSAVG